jgi:hypothetical protein
MATEAGIEIEFIRVGILRLAGNPSPVGTEMLGHAFQ